MPFRLLRNGTSVVPVAFRALRNGTSVVGAAFRAPRTGTCVARVPSPTLRARQSISVTTGPSARAIAARRSSRSAVSVTVESRWIRMSSAGSVRASRAK